MPGASKDIMRTLLHSLLLLFILLGAGVVSMATSYGTGRITIQVDASEEATVGLIQRKGFPVWFYEQAPGISIMSGWKFDRFLINSAVWLVLFGIIVAMLLWKTRPPQDVSR
jgi:hypothetical protein